MSLFEVSCLLYAFNQRANVGNTRSPQADLAVVKTVSPSPAQSGQVVTYSLTVNNTGPDTATNVVLTDTPGAGLDCTTPSTTATCTATGGASCPGPSTNTTVPVSALTGAGITLPAVPVNGQVVVQMQCAVTASAL